MAARRRVRRSAVDSSEARDALAQYRRKRDPSRTNEPFAVATGSEGATRAGRFVVHLHDATRAHYDLRLEVGGTLKSFAVPRGPSLDPSEKRLAIHTEDHPIAYLDFEAVIPDGNYGAGPMIVWDAGRVRYLEGTAEEGIERGKIDFELSGFKLGGRFALVHTGARGGAASANQWLLIKKQDAFASSGGAAVPEDSRSVLSGLEVAELPERERIASELLRAAEDAGATKGLPDVTRFVPMLCSVGNASLDDESSFYELKLDGARIVATASAGNVALRYRQGRVATRNFPEIARALARLPVSDFVLDGEIVAFDERGRPSFGRLAPRLMASKPDEVLRLASEVPVVYLVFDLVALGTWSLEKLPLRERKALLHRLVRGRGLVRALDHLEGHGQALYDFCRRERLEGVVAKRSDSRYRPGPSRSADWVKIKCERDDELVVVGWEEGRGSRKELGALRLASWDGARWVLRGKVGSGFDAATLRALKARLDALESETELAEGELAPGRGAVHFARPELVVSVRFAGFTDDGVLREPVFRGIRDDIEPEACRVAPPGGEALDPEALPELELVPAGRITHHDKVFWPKEGYTKGELASYYAAVGPALLPFLRDRPVILVRYPDGIEGKHFYQWRPPEGTPSWIRTLELRDDEDREHRGPKSVFLIDDVDALLHIVNLGCIPIHVLASRAPDLGSGDFFTIDFDVDGASLGDGVTLALALRQLLEEVGFRGYPKTSGQTGLHVLVPVGPGIPFAVTKTLAELFGRLLELGFPEIATTERRVERRGRRVFVDTGQTGRSRAIVAPYSVRAVDGATVSTPLLWEEVHAALDPKRYDILTVPMRLASLGDPMAGLLDERPDVARAVAELGKRVKR